MIDTIYIKMVNINRAAPVGYNISAIQIRPFFEVIFRTQHECVRLQYQLLIFFY